MLRATLNMTLPKWGRSYPDRSMDGKYRFRSLPIALAAASAIEYVNVFDGAANTNQPGAGGGLFGADLVFAQYNGVPGVSGGGRAITKETSMGFAATLNFADAFSRSTLGWSALWRFKDLVIGAASNVALVFNTNGGLTAYLTMSALNRRKFDMRMAAINAAGAAGVSLANSDTTSSTPADTGFTMLVSVDYATKTCFVGLGIGLSQKTQLGDYFYHALTAGDIAFAAPPASTAYTRSNNAVVGVCSALDFQGGTVGVTACSVTFAKYPAVVPA